MLIESNQFCFPLVGVNGTELYGRVTISIPTGTKGEPFNTSVMAAMHVYNTAFTYKNYGMGQAEALILFIVCAIVGVTQVMIGKKGEVEA